MADLPTDGTGHRDRLRQRFREGGHAALQDYELLELLLFKSIPRKDTKPLARALLDTFGDFNRVLAAPPERLLQVNGVGEQVITDLKVVEAANKTLDTILGESEEESTE